MAEFRPQKELFSLLKYGATISVAIIISMGAFWLSYGKDLVTRAEARTLVNEGTQRVEKEIDNVNNRLDRIDDGSDKLEEQLRTVLKANTDAIVDLKVQVSSLTQTIESLSDKINQLKEN